MAPLILKVNVPKSPFLPSPNRQNNENKSAATDRLQDHVNEISENHSSFDSIFATGFSKPTWDSWTKSPFNLPTKSERYLIGFGLFNKCGNFTAQYVPEAIELIRNGGFDPLAQETLLRTFISSDYRRKYLRPVLHPKKNGRVGGPQRNTTLRKFLPPKARPTLGTRRLTRSQSHTSKKVLKAKSQQTKNWQDAHSSDTAQASSSGEEDTPIPPSSASSPTTISRNHGAATQSIAEDSPIDAEPLVTQHSQNLSRPQLSDLDLSTVSFRAIDQYVMKNFTLNDAICGSTSLKDAIEHLNSRDFKYFKAKRLLLKLLDFWPDIVPKNNCISKQVDCLPPYFNFTCLIHSTLGFFIYEKLSTSPIRQPIVLTSFLRDLTKKHPRGDFSQTRKEFLREKFSTRYWSQYLLQEPVEWAHEADHILSNMTKNVGRVENQFESLKTLFTEILNIHTRLVIQLGNFGYLWPARGDKINSYQHFSQGYNGPNVVLPKLFGLQVLSDDGTEYVVRRAEVWS